MHFFKNSINIIDVHRVPDRSDPITLMFLLFAANLFRLQSVLSYVSMNDIDPDTNIHWLCESNKILLNEAATTLWHAINVVQYLKLMLPDNPVGAK